MSEFSVDELLVDVDEDFCEYDNYVASFFQRYPFATNFAINLVKSYIPWHKLDTIWHPTHPQIPAHGSSDI